MLFRSAQLDAHTGQVAQNDRQHSHRSQEDGTDEGASENLAAGLVQQLDFDTASRKLYHVDYLIMMTDGVLDALPTEREEETMKEIIMDVREKEPREMGRGILERVLGYSDYHARDDMTVVVAGLWKK